MRNKRIPAFALAVLSAVLLFAGGTSRIAAAPLPSLFYNDEAWYKDSFSPLLVREGKTYVPAELFGMFQSIRVTVPAGENLLIENTATGGYVSILFRDGTSAVNGEIGTDVGVFRDGSVYYVEAEPVCRAVGLTTEVYGGEDGAMSLRVTDGSERLTMDQLAAAYEPGALPPEEGAFWPDVPIEETTVGAKKLYIWCTSPEEGTNFSVEREIERLGMNATVFLWDDAGPEEILAGQSFGAYGVATTDEGDTAGTLSAANQAFSRYTGRKTRWTITTGDGETDETLRAAGFCPLHPDFTVTDAVDPAAVIQQIEPLFSSRDSVTVFLTDCRNGETTVSLLRALLDYYPDWKDANLGGGN